jgi:hypothetical protein
MVAFNPYLWHISKSLNIPWSGWPFRKPPVSIIKYLEKKCSKYNISVHIIWSHISCVFSFSQIYKLKHILIFLSRYMSDRLFVLSTSFIGWIIHEIKSDIIFYEFHVIVLVLQIFGTHDSTDAPVPLSKLRLLGYLYLCQNYFYWDTCISVKITSIVIPVSLSKLLLLGYLYLCIWQRYRYPK